MISWRKKNKILFIAKLVCNIRKTTAFQSIILIVFKLFRARAHTHAQNLIIFMDIYGPTPKLAFF